MREATVAERETCYRDELRIAFDGRGESAGRFLDIGAADGWVSSMSMWPALHGWSGVLVEACSIYVKKLHDIYGNDPRFEIVHGLVTPEATPSLVRFWECADACLSTADESLIRRKIGREQNASHLMMGIPVSVLEDRGPYDLISIDAEGWSIPIFRAMKSRPGIFIVEYFHASVRGVDELAELSKIGEEKGYEVIGWTLENVVLGRRGA